MNILKETDKIKVWVDGDIKYFRSPDFNYEHNLVNGFCKTWGKTEEDDPEYSPYGPCIIDAEITTICGHGCQMCYKSNTSNGQNMSFETFKQIIENMDYNCQVQSVAFGLGATGEENHDLWKMCEWLRERYIIPNGTLVDLNDATALKVAMTFGAVAISLHHGDFETLANTIEKLSIAKTMHDTTLKQINIHQVIYKENFAETMALLEFVKKDERFKDLNAIVFLGLKNCGRADNDNFNIIGNEEFEKIVFTAIQNKIGIGFDSCSCTKVSNLFKEKILKIIEQIIKDYENKKVKKETAQIVVNKFENELKQLLQLCDPCESGIFSSYTNVKGEYHNCSFQEHTPGCNLLTDNFQDYWENSDNIKNWRKMLKKSNRSCPLYIV